MILVLRLLLRFAKRSSPISKIALIALFVSGTFSGSSQANATVTSSVNGWGQAEPAVFSESTLLSTPQEMYTSSVSCSSPGNCTAVGQFRNSTSGLEAFTMTSTGGVWGTARPAQFADGIQSTTPNAFLFWVSCSSPGNCTAVGQFRDINEALQAFTVTSTGGVWGTARPAQFADGIQSSTPNSVFNSVSCASPGNCTAVGQFLNSTGGYEAFTMTSTNGVWGTARPAVFIDLVQDVSKNGLFTSVSCASPGNCTAIGLVRNSIFTNKAFTMTSTNSVWGTARPAVFPADIESNSLSSAFNSVSCASPDNCTAVGRFQYAVDDFQAFTMSLANGVWDFASPAQFNAGFQNIEPDDVLSSVSCATPGNCTAVGDFMNSAGRKEAFTYTSLNGVWGAAEPAEFSDGVRSNSGSASFYSVSCPTQGNCTALGDFSSIASGRKAFTATSVKQSSTPPDEGWDQARPAEFPNGIFGFSEILVSSVSCASPGNCTVVGSVRHIIPAFGFHAYTMTSTNGVWAPAQLAKFPNGVEHANASASFTSVSCTSPGNCTAVGKFKNIGSTYEAFTMTSTGGAWELARPAVFVYGIQHIYSLTDFKSVSCASPGNCTAVGQFRNSEGPIEAYNNESFTMTSTNGVWALARPAVFPVDVQAEFPNDDFRSVSCPTAGNCTAVGQFKNIDNSQEAFTMTLTNGVWALARPAVFPNGTQSEFHEDDFRSVSCPTAGNCTAVGTFITVDNSREAFTMTSTNDVWALARPAEFPENVEPIASNSQLASVSCPTAGNCTTVGSFQMDSGGGTPFTLTSTNGVWALARPAEFPSGIQTNPTYSAFTSVSCASPGNCTAAGYFTLASVSAESLFTMSSVDNTISSDSTSESATTSTTATTSTVAPSTTTITPSTTTIASPEQSKPKIVVQQNKQNAAPATPAESTSTTTTTSQGASNATLTPQLQTSSESGSIGWWLLGGSSTIGLWWIIVARRRRREDALIAKGSEG